MLSRLQLRRAPTPTSEACAWFLPGEDPAEWLETVCAWPEAAATLMFYPLSDPATGQPVGALVVTDSRRRGDQGPLADGKTSRKLDRGRALPYGRAADGFYLPADALLFPPVSEEELHAAKRHPVQIWHPTLGLCGFEAHEGRRAWDLLLPPPLIDEAWHLARAVEPTNRRLRRVRLLAPLSLDTLFGGESEDIGAEPLVDLPPGADEPRPGIASKLGRGVLGAGALGARGLIALTGLVPRGHGPATWVNHLENWAARKLGSVTKDLERERHRELHSLLDLLQRDPATALKHAIPLTGLDGRGKAPPSARLGERSLDFDLRRLGGHGPADNWAVPDDLRANLAAQYRAAAQREAALGRHRRAARIYAELLGDFSAAAEMLKRGRFFAEAAVLYRERLRNEIAEAGCLAEGGFLDEAIAIHERSERWPEVAALQEKAGRPEAARAAWRRTVEKLRGGGERLSAAKLLETRLDAPDEALAELAAGWPHGRQALACLAARFDLLGRRHDHATIGALLAELSETEPPSGLLSGLISQLAGQAQTLLHEPNRQAAAEVARLRISAALTKRALDGADEIAALRALTQLEPQDRLLKRDVLRFRESRARTAPPPLPQTTAPTALVRKIELQKGTTISLPRVGIWMTIQGDERTFRAVARTPAGKLFLTHGAWSGAMRSMDWPDPQADAARAPILAELDMARIVLARPFRPPLEPKLFWSAAAFDDGADGRRVVTPPWWTEDIVCAAPGRNVFWTLRVVGERVILESRVLEALTHSWDLTESLNIAGAGVRDEPRIEATGGDGRVALGFGQRLLVVDGDRPVEWVELGGAVRDLLPGPAARPGWVVLMERGASFVDAETREVSELDGQMESPFGAWLGDARLVLAGRNEGRLFACRETVLAAEAWFAFSGEGVIALSRAAHPREFATFDAAGVGQRWQVIG